MLTGCNGTRRTFGAIWRVFQFLACWPDGVLFVLVVVLVLVLDRYPVFENENEDDGGHIAPQSAEN